MACPANRVLKLSVKHPISAVNRCTTMACPANRVLKHGRAAWSVVLRCYYNGLPGQQGAETPKPLLLAFL